MHVVLVSACEKRAIKKTRAVLDSFAMRIGPTTWVSAITAEGLSELKLALKRVATRQTAVACFQNDGRRRMKVIWIIGSRSSFGTDGHYPSGSTMRKKNFALSISPWIRMACMVAKSAGLMHDIGKASQKFQEKLKGAVSVGDDVRHEWISMKLLQTMRVNGHDWNDAWKTLKMNIGSMTLGGRQIKNRSPQSIESALETIDFVIVTHHGLMSCEATGSLPTSQSRHVRRDASLKQVSVAGRVDESIFQKYWNLESRVLALSQEIPMANPTVYWRAIAIYARTALIFADHTVSMQQKCMKDDGINLFANTFKSNSARILNQTLNWHLEEVGDLAQRTILNLAQLSGFAGASEAGLPVLSEDAQEKICRPVSDSRFFWQNTSAAALAKARAENGSLPALVFNMAGTGSGKTRMNARAACVLSRDGNPRFSIALNLRSLTLQTGNALQTNLGIDADEIAVIIGSQVVQDLFENSATADRAALIDPSNEDENPLEDSYHSNDEHVIIPMWMSKFFRTEKERTIVGSPILISTIDFLGAAGSPGAQGNHVKSVIRIMSSDLVLDEIDSYEPESMSAVMRLIQLSAFFGRNVICSSATIAHPVAVAIERAFGSGIEMRLALRENTSIPPVDSPGFICAMIDDALQPHIELVKTGHVDFEKAYRDRTEKIEIEVATKPLHRLATMAQVPEQTKSVWFDSVLDAVKDMHAKNKWEFLEKKRQVSFGLIRVANISTAIELARFMSEKLPGGHIACYHSGDFLISRFNKERRLDKLLTRTNGNHGITTDEEIVRLVTESKADEIQFIVVATPVEEIGRDHDFDWAVIEPSSVQSIIQASGRVNRHRHIRCNGTPNIAVMRYNLRHCRNAELGHQDRPAFVYPGYEKEASNGTGLHQTHDIRDLLPWSPNNTLPIHSGIRFNSKCKFAIADDDAITKRIAKYFGEGGCFVRSPIPSWTITDGPGSPYAKTPLRDKTSKTQYWRIVLVAGKATFARKKRIQAPGTNFLVDTWLAMDIPINEMAQNAWLALQPTEMHSMCESLSVEPLDGMTAELTAYDEDSEFQYDLGFGVSRVAQIVR